MIPEKSDHIFFYFDTHHHSWIFSISISISFLFCCCCWFFLLLWCMSSEFNLIPTAPTVYPHQNLDHSLFSYQFVGDGVDAVAVAVLVGDLVVIGTFVGDLVGGDTVGELVVIGTFVVGLVLGAVVGRFVGRFVGRQPDLVQSEFPEPKVGFVVGDLAVDEVGEGVVGDGVGSGTGSGTEIGEFVQSGLDLVHAEFPDEILGLLLLLLLPSAFTLFISPPIDARER